LTLYLLINYYNYMKNGQRTTRGHKTCRGKVGFRAFPPASNIFNGG
jgi:hypothetical protein